MRTTCLHKEHAFWNYRVSLGQFFFLLPRLDKYTDSSPKQLSILLKTSYPSCVGKLLFSISNYLFFMKDSLSLNNFAPEHEGICDNKLPFSITVFHRTNDLDGFLPCHPVSCIQHLFVAKTTYSLIKLRTTFQGRNFNEQKSCTKDI